MSRGRAAGKRRDALWLLGVVVTVLVWRYPWAAVPGLLLLYVGICAKWPFMKCRKCQGTGRCFAPFGSAFRTCPRCGGDGEHVRYGRQLWTWTSR